MSLTELFVGIAIAVGLIGILVPVLPGSALILVAILVWALELGSATGWTAGAIPCSSVSDVATRLCFARPAAGPLGALGRRCLGPCGLRSARRRVGPPWSTAAVLRTSDGPEHSRTCEAWPP